MGFWRREDGPRQQPRSALQRRVAKMGTAALYDWLDVSVMGMGRAVSDARRNDNGPALEEIESGALAVLAVVRELQTR